MPGQLESVPKQQRDSEIQDCEEEIAATLEAAFDTLIERRDTAYADAIAPLDEEAESLAQEHVDIGAAAHNLELLLPSTARLAQHEADQLTVAGKTEKARAKLEEMRQAENAPVAMKARQREIDLRLTAIEGEKRAIAKRIFDQWYGECQQVIRAAEHGLFITILDGLRDSFFQFQTVTDTVGDGVRNTLFRVGHITGLTADEHSREWASGSRWYGGRGRR